MEYLYKVINVEAEVTSADVRKKVAGSKIQAQIELTLQQFARDGWELQGQFTFNVNIKAGCFDVILKLLGQATNDGEYHIYQLVFRKPA